MFKSPIKLSVLHELNQKDLSGYDLMKYFEASGKKPSPGYLYPLLNDLQDKGFISLKKEGRKKVYSITKKGKKLLKDLERNRIDMLGRMAKLLGGLADKEEMKNIIEMRKGMLKHKLSFRDKMLLERFHSAMFSVFKKKDEKNIEKMKKILETATKEIESLEKMKKVDR
jgi:DNA-binding PadR family transcriptional regulator